MAERAPTTFGCIVGGLPVGVVQKYAKPVEVVTVQVLLLFVKGDDRRTRGVSLPDSVTLLGVRRSPAFAAFIVPDGKPCLKECSRHGQGGSDGPSQETRQPLRLLKGQVLWPMQKSVRYRRKSSRTLRTSSQSFHGAGGDSMGGVSPTAATNSAMTSEAGGVSLSQWRTVS